VTDCYNSCSKPVARQLLQTCYPVPSVAAYGKCLTAHLPYAPTTRGLRSLSNEDLEGYPGATAGTNIHVWTDVRAVPWASHRLGQPDNMRVVLARNAQRPTGSPTGSPRSLAIIATRLGTTHVIAGRRPNRQTCHGRASRSLRDLRLCSTANPGPQTPSAPR